MGREARGSESGQATLEWIGLVLCVALALGGGAVATGGADFESEADELGEAVAQRVTCGVHGACARSPARSGGRSGAPSGRRSGAPSGGRAKPSPELKPMASAPKRAEAGGDALRLLGKAGTYGSLACLGYHRFKYDLDHPLTPRQGIPVGDTLGLLNTCLNPLGFLFP